MKSNIILSINHRQVRVDFLLLLTVLFFSQNTIVKFLGEIGISTRIAGGFFLVLQGIFLFGYLLFSERRVPWDSIVLLLSIYTLFLLTYFIHPEYKPFLDGSASDGKYEAFSSVLRFGCPIYGYYIIRQFEEKEELLYEAIKYIGFILLINIWMIFNRTSGYGYRMDFGYHMEMSAITFLSIYLYNIRKRKKTSPLYFILSVFAMTLGLLFGSRACVIGYVIFIAIMSFWNNKPSSRQVIIVCFLVAVFVVINSTTLLTAIYQFFKSIGFDSRTLSRFISGDISTDNARENIIWPMLWERIQNSGFFEGHGAYADRYYLSGRYVYAHNVFIEILLTFGKVWGSLVIIYILISTFITYQKCKDISGLITMMFASFSLARLFFSSSFWYEPYFWAYLAMLKNTSIIRSQRKRNRKALP